MTGERPPTGDYEAYEAVEAPSDTEGSRPRASAAGLALHLDALRVAAGKTEALAATAVESYDGADWRGADGALVERIAYLLGAVAEAARAVVVAVARFHGFVADRQRAGDDGW